MDEAKSLSVPLGKSKELHAVMEAWTLPSFALTLGYHL